MSNETKPIVSPVMLDAACSAYGCKGFDRQNMRGALEAALAVQPKPQLTPAEETLVKSICQLLADNEPEAGEAFDRFIDRLTGEKP